jgi:PHS family inorganic phosphate transporter-like MFS transporter
MTIPETPRYTMDIERNVQQAAQDVETFYTTGKSFFLQNTTAILAVVNGSPFFCLLLGKYTKEDDAPLQRVEVTRASRRDFIKYFSKWENGKVLLGTSWSWFALDIAFYGLSLNSSVILTAINFGAPSMSAQKLLGHQKTVWLNLHNVSVGNIVLAFGGLIPGYYASMALIDIVRLYF